MVDTLFLRRERRHIELMYGVRMLLLFGRLVMRTRRYICRGKGRERLGCGFSWSESVSCFCLGNADALMKSARFAERKYCR